MSDITIAVIVGRVRHAADEDVLTPLLFRLTSTKELPILLVGGHTVGSVPEIRYLNTKGDLKTMITRAGAVIDGGKKKKGRKH